MFNESEILKLLNFINWKGSESDLSQDKDTKNILEKIIKDYPNNKIIQEEAKNLLDFYFK